MDLEQLKQSNLLFLLDVRKSYGSHVILDDIDLSVTAGEFCTVVGPSGCGKSTLLRLILGQETPSAGGIFIDGSEAGFANPERGIVYQQYSLFPHLTVLENVLLGRKMVSSFRHWREKRQDYIDEAMSYLKKVDLAGDLKKYPHQLSGGMQQRVAIVQSLIMKPKILLMDEPFGALDPGTRENMQLYLLELWKETRMTIFFVTHDLEEAIFLGTRLLVLSRFYSDDRELSPAARGARIVTDLDLGSYKSQPVSATEIKYTASFRTLIKQLRQEGFDPGYLQHVTTFNLKHPHSFQTLDEEVAHRD